MSSDHDDYAVEPIRGIPEALPPGEQILWQGAPDAWEMAKHVFHIRLVAAYLLALMAWRFSVHLQTGGIAAATISVLSLLTISLVALGLLAMLAWLCSRTSVYTITSRRVIMRIGVALPTAVNLPFCAIGAAALCARRGGSGDISLAVTGDQRLAWSNFWPHVRPWRLNRPQPMLRCIANVEVVADILTTAMAAALPEGAIRTAIRPAGQGAFAPSIAVAEANPA